MPLLGVTIDFDGGPRGEGLLLTTGVGIEIELKWHFIRQMD